MSGFTFLLKESKNVGAREMERVRIRIRVCVCVRERERERVSSIHLSDANLWQLVRCICIKTCFAEQTFHLVSLLFLSHKRWSVNIFVLRSPLPVLG